MKIEFDLDIKKITDDLLENGKDSEYNSLQSGVKDEIKRWASQIIAEDIKKHLDLDSLREQTYSRNYLKDEAKKILDRELKDLVEKQAETYFKRNMEYLVIGKFNSLVEEKILPKLQKIVDSMMVVNPIISGEEKHPTNDKQ